MKPSLADDLSPAFDELEATDPASVKATRVFSLLHRNRALTWPIAVPYKPRDFARPGRRAIDLERRGAVRRRTPCRASRAIRRSIR